MTEVREPTKDELRAVKFVVEQLDACGDNTEKKIRFLAMLTAHQNDVIDEHKRVTAMYEERRYRKNQKDKARRWRETCQSTS